MLSNKLRSQMNKVLPKKAYGFLKRIDRLLSANRKSNGFSEDEAVIHRVLKNIEPTFNSFFVDLAAQDGVAGSQTLALLKSGWEGLCIEGDGRDFATMALAYQDVAHVKLFRGWITPANATDVLRAAGCPTHFGFLSLDIDGYDHFILEAILDKYTPTVMCIEINEVIPPPIRFAVRYSESFKWGGDHFQGQSLMACYDLVKRFGYHIEELHYNNLILVHSSHASNTLIDPEQAYASGYRDKKDRMQKFPQNLDFEAVLLMGPDQARKFIEEQFLVYAGKYDLS
jgi:hypothetical protein